jgi:hypothetical protein
MTEKQYKNPFTLDGRLKPAPNVTPAKVSEMKKLVDDALSGDYIATAKIKEAMTSTDAIFSFAYLTQINFIPQFARVDRTWQTIAGTRTVNDFRRPVLYSMVTNWGGPGVLGAEPANSNGVIPVVPEGAPYPYAYMNGEESKAAGISKRGFKTDFTFEAFIDDALGFISALPDEMLRVALDSEDYEIYNALVGGATTGASGLQGGTVPDGEVVTANSPLTHNAVLRAVYELSQRKVNGRFVQVNGGYNLVVPIGQKAYAQYQIGASLFQTRTGTSPQYLYTPGFTGLPDIEIVESQWVSGTNWYLIPKPGTTARPILEHLTLRGHEVPELRVENTTGVYIGGGAVSPFEGSFDNDSAVFRLRMFTGAILWSPELVVYSNGSGS